MPYQKGEGKSVVIALGGNALGNTPREQLELVKATAKNRSPHLLKIFAKSFNYRGCYEHVFSSLGIQRYPFSSAGTDERCAGFS